MKYLAPVLVVFALLLSAAHSYSKAEQDRHSAAQLSSGTSN